MDYMPHICMIIICITLHISVWLLTIINHLCECLAISVHVWQSEYVPEYLLHTKLFFLFLFIAQIILIVFFSGQINHLYDV